MQRAIIASLNIVRAQLEHLPAIARLAKIVWHDHYPGIISQAQIDYMLERMYALDTLRGEVASGVTYNCLFASSELVGFSAHSPVEHEMKLHKLYIHPAHQRKGHGSTLLREVERDTHARGYKTLILAVNKANQKAVAAYRKNGFEVRDAVTVGIGGGFVMDDYVMVKKMAAPSGDAAKLD